jgi:hypothetical protein
MPSTCHYIALSVKNVDVIHYMGLHFGTPGAPGSPGYEHPGGNLPHLWALETNRLLRLFISSGYSRNWNINIQILQPQSFPRIIAKHGLECTNQGYSFIKWLVYRK